MRVIPVLDIMGGEVVHGVGGIRSRYRPIVSRVTNHVDPPQVARDLMRAFGFKEIYIADLDAIGGRGNNMDKTKQVLGLGYSVYLDAGFGGAGDITPALSAVDHLVMGTETLQSLQELRVACRLHRSVVASLDFKGDELLARDRALKGIGVGDLVHALSGAGISEMIYLDLARVGMGSGITSERMENVISSAHVPVIVGGGVRSASDIQCLDELGAAGALVATSIHSGELTPKEIELIHRPRAGVV